MRRRALQVISVLDAVTLVALRPHPGQLRHDLGAPADWLARVGIDGAVEVLAALGLWLAAAWFGVGLLAAIAGRLPGAAGRASAALGSALLPRVLYRIVAGSAGLGLLLGPVVTAGAAPPAVSSGPSAVPSTVAAPSWPSEPAAGSGIAPPGPAATRPAASTGPAAPAPSWPSAPSTSTPPPAAPRASSAPRAPAAPSASPPGRVGSTRATPTAAGPSSAAPRQAPASPTRTPGHRTPTVAAAPPRAGREPVRVHTGDSLWLVAARRLGPSATDAQIAAEWPRWYAANRAVIGDDPALIRPGQVLHAPPITSETAPPEAP